MSLSQELGNSTSNGTYVSDDSCGGNSSINRGNSGSVSGSSEGTEGHSLVTLFHCIVRISCLSSVFFLSLLENILLLVVFYRKPQLLQVANRFILNLIVSDLFQTIVSVPFVVMGSLPSLFPLQKSTCNIFVTLMLVFALASTYTIAVVSVERYLSIIYPLSYPNKLTSKWGAIVILSTWVFSLIQSIPPAIGWGEIDFDKDSSMCTVIWEASPSYAAMNFLMAFFCPLVILIGCYSVVLRAAQRQNALVHPIRLRSLEEPVEEITASGEEASEEEEDVDGDGIIFPIPRYFQARFWRRRTKTNPYICKAARVIFVIITSFILSMGPFCMMAVISAGVGAASPWVNTFIYLFLFMQCCLHPYTYGYMHKSIQKELTFVLLDLFCRRPRRCRNSSTENNIAMTVTMTEPRAAGAAHQPLTPAWKF